MHHMRTFPFVNHKHNVIEALGHQALMLRYAIALILRNDSESTWREEWFPREGYGWFICFLSVVVLPSPTVYFYYKESHSVTGTRWTNASTTKNPVEADDRFGQENPLAMDVAIEVDSDPSDTTQPSRTQVAKRQREAKNMRAQVQQLQTQIRQLEAENTSLKAVTTATDESTKVQALQAETAALKVRLAQKAQTDGTQPAILSDEAHSTETQQQAIEKSSEAAMKELATDETLSEETRESAKQALDELAGTQIKSVALESKNVALERDKKATLRKLAIVVNEDMTKYLQGLRLLHYADAVITVVGM
jgi:TolA-binding protein